MKVRITIREYLGTKYNKATQRSTPIFGPYKSITIKTTKSIQAILQEIADNFGVEIKGVGRPRKEKKEVNQG